MVRCKYEGTGVFEGLCLGTKECDSCIGYERCATFKPDRMTNADSIRAMSDEELAHLLWTDVCYTTGGDNRNCGGDCLGCIENWLKQPVKDGDDE